MDGSGKHVVVLGAGVIGAFTALRLAAEGCRVTIVGQQPYGRGASWRSFAWINANAPVPEPYHHLRTVSVARYRELSHHQRYGKSITFSGMLSWELPDLPIEVVQGSTVVEGPSVAYTRLRELGHAVESLSAAEAGRLEPLLNPDVLPADGILWTADEGWIEMPALIGDVLADAVALGATFVADRDGASLSTSGGRVTGVTLSDGSRIDADAVLVSAGAATPELFAAVGVEVPVSSNTAVQIVTEPVSLRPRRMIRTPWGTLRPDSAGRLVIHSQVGDDTATRRGHDVTPDLGAIDSILASMSEQFVAGVGPLAVDRLGTGVRPIPGGDGLTIAGAVDGLPGAYIAFTHSGASLAPVLGDLLAAELVHEGLKTPTLEPFRLGRY